jgi:hypothetical protein
MKKYSFEKKLEECHDFADVFELVKEGVEKTLEQSRAGLMLGLANLGGSPGFFLGAYYTLDSNMIVMNTYPLQRLSETDRKLVKPYVYGILLHEYLHTIGYHAEEEVRKLTYGICVELFGNKHLVSQLAEDIRKFLPNLSHPNMGWFPKHEPEIFIVSGFDKGNLTYVS